MRNWQLGAALAVGAFVLTACSDPIGTCGNSEGLGIPALDLVGSLRARGAVVTELGQRLDLTTFSVPTQVLDLDGEEVLVWEYCTGGGQALAMDLGQYGFGVFAEDPPSLTLGPGEHLWTFAQFIVSYDGVEPGVISLLSEVLGEELSGP